VAPIIRLGLLRCIVDLYLSLVYCMNVLPYPFIIMWAMRTNCMYVSTAVLIMWIVNNIFRSLLIN